MPGFLKASLNVQQAHALLNKFTLVEPENIFSGDIQPRLHRTNAVLLYVSQPAKKLTYAKGLRHFNNQSRKVEIEKYHRFLVFGVPGGTTVMALFSQNSEDSRRLLRYNDYLRPGTLVSILKATVEGQLTKSGTPLITTNEPLIPLEEKDSLITLPPYDVEGTNLTFQFFSFVTKDLTVDSAVVAELCCPGNVCDAQTFHDTCGCLDAPNEKLWAIKLEFKCPELNYNVHCDDYHCITSSQMTKHFVTPGVRALSADSPKLDRFDLDESVQKMVASVNGKQGYRIVGWFKPASDEDGTAVEHKRFHVCCLLPEKDLDQVQNKLKYSLPSITAGTSLNLTEGSG